MPGPSPWGALMGVSCRGSSGGDSLSSWEHKPHSSSVAGGSDDPVSPKEKGLEFSPLLVEVVEIPKGRQRRCPFAWSLVPQVHSDALGASGFGNGPVLTMGTRHPGRALSPGSGAAADGRVRARQD